MTDQQHIKTVIGDALDKWDDSDDDSSATDAILAALDQAGLRIVPNAGIGSFMPMETWDARDEAVLLMVDYSNDGHHAIDDATVAITIGHNNDHNVGDDEAQGWLFAGWCWTQDHYTQGVGKPIGWLPLSTQHEAARAIESQRDAALATLESVKP